MSYRTMNLRDADETEVEVEYTATGGCPAHMGSLSYEGHPAEAPEIEIVRVTRSSDGSEVKLSDEEHERIETELAETHEDDLGDDWYFD